MYGGVCYCMKLNNISALPACIPSDYHLSGMHLVKQFNIDDNLIYLYLYPRDLL